MLHTSTLRATCTAIAVQLASTSGVAYAEQDMPRGTLEIQLDTLGVNVSQGTVFVSDIPIQIGDPSSLGLNYQRFSTNGRWSDNFNYNVSASAIFAGSEYGYSGSGVIVTTGRNSENFETYIPMNNALRPTSKNGASLVDDGQQWGTYMYVGRDGTAILFNKPHIAQDHYGAFGELSGGIGSVLTSPNEKKITFIYQEIYSGSSLMRRRISSVQTNAGYQAKFEYMTNAVQHDNAANLEQWLIVKSVKLINSKVEYCAPVSNSCSSLVHSWPTISFTQVVNGYLATDTSTGPSGDTRVYQWDGLGYNYPFRTRALTNVSIPGQSSGLVFNWVPSSSTRSIHNSDGVYNYSLQFIGRTDVPMEWDDAFKLRLIRTAPDGSTNEILSYLNRATVLHKVDELSRTRRWIYDGAGRLIDSIPPEATMSGDTPVAGHTHNDYDARGNLVQTTKVAKAGSGLPNIVTSAGYDVTCANPKTCNQPNWTKDAKGNQTDFTYDPNHGGVLSEIKPPPSAGGARPLKLMSYAQRSAWIKNSSGALVQSPDPIWLPASQTECQTAAGSSTAVCDGAAPQTVTTYEYGANGTRESLLVKGIAVTSGGTTLRTCYTYDIYDRKISETKPNANLGACP